MAALNRLGRGLEIVLEVISAVLVVTLTAIVVYAVLWRYLGGSSPRWYDEVAAIMLVWLTYYAGALAALKRGHIGVDGVLLAMPRGYRMAGAVAGEVVVVGFFVVLAWAGTILLEMLQGMALISLRWVPLRLTHSVIPIGAALFVIAQLLSMPSYFAKVRSGISQEHEEIEQALAIAEEARMRDRPGIAGEDETRRI